MLLISGASLLFVSWGTSDARGSSLIPTRPQFRNMDANLIFNSGENRTFDWTQVATADYYVLEWSPDPTRKDGKGNYTSMRDDSGILQSRTFVLDVDNRFQEGWWYFHVAAFVDRNSDGTPEEMSEWSDELRMGMDYEQPVVTVTEPVPGKLLTTELITFKGTAGDKLGLKEIQYAVDGDGNYLIGHTFSDSPPSGNWSIPDLSFESGIHSIEIKAVDIADKYSVVRQFHFTVDLGAPNVQISAPMNGIIFTGSNEILFEGSADDDFGICEMYYWLNGVRSDIQGSAWSHNIILSEGTNDISVLAVDEVGIHTYNNITVFYNSRPPEIFIDSLVMGDWNIDLVDRAGDPVILESNVTDGVLKGRARDECGLTSIQLAVDDEQFNDVSIPEGISLERPGVMVEWQAEIHGLDEGLHQVTVRATDPVANDGSELVRTTSVTFVRDANDPSLDMASDGWNGNGSIPIRNDRLAVRVSAQDDVAISVVEYQLDDGDWNELYSYDPDEDADGYETFLSEDIDIPIEEDGLYRLTILVRDLAGNEAIRTYEAVRDGEDPTVQIRHPGEDAIIDGTEVRLDTTFSDNLGLAYVEVFIDNPGKTRSWGSRSERSSATRNEEIESVGSDVSQDGGDSTVLRVPDARTDLDGKPTATWETVLELGNGENVLTVIVFDLGGRSAKQEIRIWIDTDLPTVSIEGPTGGESMDTSELTIVGNSGDDSDHIKRVEVRVLRAGDVDTVSDEHGWDNAQLENNTNWSYVWDVDEPGPKVIQVRAVDETGKVSEVAFVDITIDGDGAGGGGGDDDDGGAGGTYKKDPNTAAPGAAIMILALFIVIILVLVIVLIVAGRSAKAAEKRVDELEEEIRSKKSG